MTAGGLRVRHVVRGAPVTGLSFDGRPLAAYAGESVAAALWAAGLRPPQAAPDGPPRRTLFCAMGVCQQCVLWIDGRRIESCRVPARDGMEVRSDPPRHGA